jgi:NADPH:quinone reductase-like Zn-dependent oxidoreductase
MKTIPETMQAVAIDRFGGPEVLSLRTLPMPVPKPQQVLIALHTSGVAGWDAEMREGWSPDGHTQFPRVLGTDGAGTVVAVGSRIERLQPGDKVYAYDFLNAGFYAEYVVVAAANASSIPKGIDLEHAGAIPATGLTALQGIDNALHVKKGENVIVHGASGGVGSLALQFAKLCGARVLATATGEDGLSFVRRLGADSAVDGRSGDIVAEARRFAPGGVDAVLALAGGKALTLCLNTLRRGGRLAYPNGIEPAPRKRGGIEMVSYDGAAGIREFERLTRAVEEARLEIPIAASYPLADTVKAHQRLAEGHVLGKIVLHIR